MGERATCRRHQRGDRERSQSTHYFGTSCDASEGHLIITKSTDSICSGNRANTENCRCYCGANQDRFGNLDATSLACIVCPLVAHGVLLAVLQRGMLLRHSLGFGKEAPEVGGASCRS